LEAAVKELDPATVAQVASTAEECLGLLAAIDRSFKDNAGEASFPSFEPLRKELKHITAWLGGAAAPGADAAGQTAVDGGDAAGGETISGGGAAVAAGPGFSGAVRNRDDAVRALDAVIAYYRAVEPSSPVPYLLKRAKRLATMDFMQVMMELSPESRDKILLATGPVEDTPA
jgi:type VI secretion system protein ImpA